ncbi:MAG: terpene cyclase/mutase family protein [Planctomycetes bacterium]|nr:terpene cyclase/mutase family protein [Planctomycetota bacterium]
MSNDQAVVAPASESVQAVTKPRRRWLKVLGIVVLLLGITGWYLWTFERTSHSTPTKDPEKVADSGDKYLDAIKRGIEYLKVHQEADGGFSRGILDPKPAFTALVVESLAQGPVPYREKDYDFIRQAVEYILKYQREDGSICTPAFNLDVYSTAVSLRALKAQDNPKYAEAIEKAKNYLATTQKPIEGGNPNGGGVGYGTSWGDVSGDVSQQWVEAMKVAGVKKDSEAFKNATKFFSRIQNNPETNDLATKENVKMSDDGGFIYRAGGGGEGKPYEKLRDGTQVAQSYGLMSYAGLKSFLYMEVDKNDPRVQSAWKWVCNNYTLDENKNLGSDGLYYYYLTMAKALAAYGERQIPMENGKRKVDWAQELMDRVLSLQHGDGSWNNKKSQKWMEGDGVMVTAFAIRTLAICREFIKDHPLSEEAKSAAESAKTVTPAK